MFNDDVGSFFQMKKKAFDKRILYLHYFFNIVADMLAILVKGARDDGQINGVVPLLIDGGLSILRYADETVLFMERTSAGRVSLERVTFVFLRSEPHNFVDLYYSL
jgi:hypothetical protein